MDPNPCQAETQAKDDEYKMLQRRSCASAIIPYMTLSERGWKCGKGTCARVKSGKYFRKIRKRQDKRYAAL